MKIIIRADSGSIMGSGHVMRTLVLADSLLSPLSLWERARVRGSSDKEKPSPQPSPIGRGGIIFACRNLSGNIISVIESRGYKLQILPENINDANKEFLQFLQKEQPEILIIDNYDTGFELESAAREFVGRIIVIDDYLNRKHDCDIFLNQNFPASQRQNLDANLPSNCIQILGPEYAILREEFLSAKRKEKPFAEITNILVSFGGTDSYNLTEQLMQFFCKHEEYSKVKINFVIGWQNQNREKLKSICDSNENFIYHYEINYMAKLISEADLCIGAGGSSSWERLYIGVPSIIVSLAENQDAICEWLYNNKLAYYMGKATDFSEESFRKSIDIVANDEIWRNCALNIGQKTVDGKGVNRIIESIQKLFK